MSLGRSLACLTSKLMVVGCSAHLVFTLLDEIVSVLLKRAR